LDLDPAVQNEGVRGFYFGPWIVDRAARTKGGTETGACGGDCSPEHGLHGGASPEMACLGHLGLIQHEIGLWGKLAAWATYPSGWPEPTAAGKVRPVVEAARCGGGHGWTAVRSLREARDHNINAKRAWER
jgi:hypothetical protein